MKERGFTEAFVALFVLIILLGVILFGMWGCPKYNVYHQELAGEAELAKANYNRQIAVREAQAKKESSISLAEAEVIRADGVAKANKIIGESLKDNEAYLRYLWISNLADSKQDSQVIYIPTEAGMPILEAGRGINHTK